MRFLRVRLRVWGLGFRGLELRVWGFRVEGLGFRVEGLGFRVHVYPCSRHLDRKVPK